jgi:hypothetical protein
MGAAMKLPSIPSIDEQLDVATQGIDAPRKAARPSGQSGQIVTEFGIAGFDGIRLAFVPHGQVVAHTVVQVEVHLEAVTEIALRRSFIEHFLRHGRGAVINYSPAEKTTRRPVDKGHNVGIVFLFDTKVNSSSISATSTACSG